MILVVKRSILSIYYYWTTPKSKVFTIEKKRFHMFRQKVYR